MARTSIAAGGGVALKVNMTGVERLSEEFKTARRSIVANSHRIVGEVGAETIVPGAVALAPSFIKSTLVVKPGVRNSAYLTSILRGKRGRAVGLLEFGGTVRTTILPKHKGSGKHGAALGFRGGQVAVAAVYTPRKYRGKHFMTRAVESGAGVFTEMLADRLAAYLD